MFQSVIKCALDSLFSFSLSFFINKLSRCRLLEMRAHIESSDSPCYPWHFFAFAVALFYRKRETLKSKRENELWDLVQISLILIVCFYNNNHAVFFCNWRESFSNRLLRYSESKKNTQNQVESISIMRIMTEYCAQSDNNYVLDIRSRSIPCLACTERGGRIYTCFDNYMLIKTETNALELKNWYVDAKKTQMEKV